jgi:nitroimidazol reductase NimA-like FMN-containing flavoprotein (pyridoxamine 5'-phosphate oxidase superfamily)
MEEVQFDELSYAACLGHLRAHSVGRLAVVVDDVPFVLPVNYRFVETAGPVWVAVRARPGSVLGRGSRYVSFEIDDIADGSPEGWSVLVRGTLHHVDPDAADFRVRFDPKPWIEAGRDAWLVIEPYAVTGRRLEMAPDVEHLSRGAMHVGPLTVPG